MVFMNYRSLLHDNCKYIMFWFPNIKTVSSAYTWHTAAKGKLFTSTWKSIGARGVPVVVKLQVAWFKNTYKISVMQANSFSPSNASQWMGLERTAPEKMFGIKSTNLCNYLTFLVFSTQNCLLWLNHWKWDHGLYLNKNATSTRSSVKQNSQHINNTLLKLQDFLSYLFWSPRFLFILYRQIVVFLSINKQFTISKIYVVIKQATPYFFLILNIISKICQFLLKLRIFWD